MTIQVELKLKYLLPDYGINRCIIFGSTRCYLETCLSSLLRNRNFNHDTKCKHFSAKDTLHLWNRNQNIYIFRDKLVPFKLLFTNLNINFHSCSSQFLDCWQHPKWKVYTLSDAIPIKSHSLSVILYPYPPDIFIDTRGE